jgi:hypothetical protein
MARCTGLEPVSLERQSRIGQALDYFEPNECRNYFRKSGICVNLKS